MAAGPAYRRLENDERRRRLLDLGARLFTEHAYDDRTELHGLLLGTLAGTLMAAGVQLGA